MQFQCAKDFALSAMTSKNSWSRRHSSTIRIKNGSFRLHGDRATACECVKTPNWLTALIVAIGAKAAWAARQRLPTVREFMPAVERRKIRLMAPRSLGLLEAPWFDSFHFVSLHQMQVRTIFAQLKQYTSRERSRETAEIRMKLRFSEWKQQRLRKSLVYIRRLGCHFGCFLTIKSYPDNFYSVTTAVRNHMPTCQLGASRQGRCTDWCHNILPKHWTASRTSFVAILNGDKSMYGSVLQPDEAQVIVNVDTKNQIGLEVDPSEIYSDKTVTNDNLSPAYSNVQFASRRFMMSRVTTNDTFTRL